MNLNLFICCQPEMKEAIILYTFFGHMCNCLLCNVYIYVDNMYCLTLTQLRTLMLWMSSKSQLFKSKIKSMFCTIYTLLEYLESVAQNMLDDTATCSTCSVADR